MIGSEVTIKNPTHARSQRPIAKQISIPELIEAIEKHLPARAEC